MFLEHISILFIMFLLVHIHIGLINQLALIELFNGSIHTATTNALTTSSNITLCR